MDFITNPSLTFIVVDELKWMQRHVVRLMYLTIVMKFKPQSIYVQALHKLLLQYVKIAHKYQALYYLVMCTTALQMSCTRTCTLYLYL